MMYMGDDFSRQESEPTQCLEIRNCPDCGEPRPEAITPGEACCQCGYIFQEGDLL